MYAYYPGCALERICSQGRGKILSRPALYSLHFAPVGYLYLSVCFIDPFASFSFRARPPPLFLYHFISFALYQFFRTCALLSLSLSLFLYSIYSLVSRLSGYPSISLSTSTRSGKVGDVGRISGFSRVGCQTPLGASFSRERALVTRAMASRKPFCSTILLGAISRPLARFDDHGPSDARASRRAVPVPPGIRLFRFLPLFLSLSHISLRIYRARFCRM